MATYCMLALTCALFSAGSSASCASKPRSHARISSGRTSSVIMPHIGVAPMHWILYSANTRSSSCTSCSNSRQLLVSTTHAPAQTTPSTSSHPGRISRQAWSDVRRVQRALIVIHKRAQIPL
eukprot:6173151-Pleurochrysis_carterae.AAC.4